MNKHNLKKFFHTNMIHVLLLIVIVQLLVIVLLEFYPVYRLNKSTLGVNNSFSSESMGVWFKALENTKISNLDSSTQVEELIYFNKFAEEYNKNAAYDLVLIDISDKKQEKSKVMYSVIENKTKNLPVDKKIIVEKGKLGQSAQDVVFIGNNKLILSQSIEVEPIPNINFGGTQSKEDFESQVDKIIDNGNFQITSIDYDDGQVASVSIKNVSCGNFYSQEIKYNPKKDQIELPGYSEIKNVVCYSPTVASTSPSTYIPPKNVVTLSCSDCTLAPVDKSSALPSTYTPALVPTGISGGGYVTVETQSALQKLSQAAVDAGTSIVITSAYRSYATQQNTFNSWVSRELAKGKSYEQAVVSANYYSAFPGQSEHQLGTTLDVRCGSCEAFSRGNNPLYSFIQTQGHKYGFVVSYPKGKEHLTGYTYEPWHIRYIGVGLATELYNAGYLNAGNNVYLSSFLKQKGLY